MTPAELHGLSRPEQPAVHPDGSTIAYVENRIDVEEDHYHRTIWVGNESGVTQFTSGPGDSMPTWSPDGSSLAFLRTVDDKPQVAVIPTDGGEAEVVSAFELGVKSLAWSPDGSMIAVTATDWTDEWSDLDEDERSRRPRRIATAPYRFDGRDWIHDRKNHVYLVDPSGSEDVRCLTPGDWDESDPVWHPDGTAITFLSNRLADRSSDLGASVLRVEVESATTEEVLPHGSWVLAEYAENGDLYVIGRPETIWPSVWSVWKLTPDGDLADLTGHLDRSSISLAGGTPYIEMDGDLAYVQYENAGRVGTIAVHPDGTVDHVLDGNQVISGFSAAGGTAAYVSTTGDDPGTLFLMREGEGEAIAHASDLSLPMPEHFTTISEGVEIDVWVLLPEGSDPVPVLLNIHGGPASQYGFGFFDEFQVFVGAGYGVVACNPRGSSGKGEEFVRAVAKGGWGKVDVTDVNAALEAALARYPRLDSERIGIMGGSYGGFLSAWMIADDHRFKSAVVERGLLSFNSFAGTSDIGGSFPRHYTGGDFGDGWETWWEKSPLSRAHTTTTPTLVLHSENDFRCPIEQAEQYFMTLLRAGVTTEMLRFPGEGHEMTRSGKPRHRVERFEAIIEWHNQFLI